MANQSDNRPIGPVRVQLGSVTILNGAATATVQLDAAGVGSSTSNAFAAGRAFVSYGTGTPDAAEIGAAINATGLLTVTASGNVTADRTVNYIAYGVGSTNPAVGITV